MWSYESCSSPKQGCFLYFPRIILLNDDCPVDSLTVNQQFSIIFWVKAFCHNYNFKWNNAQLIVQIFTWNIFLKVILSELPVLIHSGVFKQLLSNGFGEVRSWCKLADNQVSHLLEAFQDVYKNNPIHSKIESPSVSPIPSHGLKLAQWVKPCIQTKMNWQVKNIEVPVAWNIIHQSPFWLHKIILFITACKCF